MRATSIIITIIFSLSQHLKCVTMTFFLPQNRSITCSLIYISYYPIANCDKSKPLGFFLESNGTQWTEHLLITALGAQCTQHCFKLTSYFLLVDSSPKPEVSFFINRKRTVCLPLFNSLAIKQIFLMILICIKSLNYILHV